MSAYIIPLLLAAILLWGLRQKVPVFALFLEGAREGIGTAANLLPTLIAITAAIGMFRASGALELLTAFFKIILAPIGVPENCLPLALLRPISGSGALVLLEDILRTAGPDSLSGRIASVMMGSTETTFYTIAVYYGAVGIKKTGATLPAALAGDIAGFLLSSLIVRLLWY